MVRATITEAATLRAFSPHAWGWSVASADPSADWLAFSPRAWGWSGAFDDHGHDSRVLPTRVGMVRYLQTAARSRHRSPHARGDGPIGSRMTASTSTFSPHAWGWSGCNVGWIRLRCSVLPTRVGMVRQVGVASGIPVVLPTRVGMVRQLRFRRLWSTRSPHARGDGPTCIDGVTVRLAFSPRAWGWSGR